LPLTLREEQELKVSENSVMERRKKTMERFVW
jgi:hypothetical protein